MDLVESIKGRLQRLYQDSTSFRQNVQEGHSGEERFSELPNIIQQLAFGVQGVEIIHLTCHCLSAPAPRQPTETELNYVFAQMASMRQHFETSDSRAQKRRMEEPPTHDELMAQLISLRDRLRVLVDDSATLKHHFEWQESDLTSEVDNLIRKLRSALEFITMLEHRLQAAGAAGGAASQPRTFVHAKRHL